MDVKGAFFTVTALILASFAVISVLVIISSSQTYDEGIQTRILTLNNFLDDSQKDFDRALQIGTARALLALTDEVVTTGIYVQDINVSFNELLLNGTYQGEEVAVMTNTTLTTWVERVQQIADDANIGISFTLGAVSVSHNTPWSIQSNVSATFLVWDKAGLANFTTAYEGSGAISILGYEDPYYVVASLGRLTNTINKTELTSFVDDDDISNLELHIERGEYINNSDAPSYLDRLQGRFNASPQGIESLVDVSRFSDQGLSTYTKSIVDHIYFSNESPSYQHVIGALAWVNLDADHLEIYEVDDLVE